MKSELWDGPRKLVIQHDASVPQDLIDLISMEILEMLEITDLPARRDELMIDGISKIEFTHGHTTVTCF